MELLTKRNGIILGIIGLILFLATPLALTLWNLDTDIFGLALFVLGLIITIAMWKGKRTDRGWLTRKKGVWLCITGVLIIFVTNFIPSLSGDMGGGMYGMIVFFLGIILIAVRWKY